MATAVKRSTVYIEADLHKALRLKSAETSRPMSELVNEALREKLDEDAEDLAAFEERKDEPSLTYEEFVKQLKRNGKL